MVQLNALQIVNKSPVIPVIVINEIENALPLANALIEGGIHIFEVTLRTACALEAITQLRKAFPNAIVGAGTVLNPEQYQQAIAAGSQFIISPGITAALLETYKNDDSIPYIPGISTISELMLGLSYGLSTFKFFPAELNGGVKALKSIGSVFPSVKFCPTGGITPENYRDYLALNNVSCVGGSWVVPEQALMRKDFSHITSLALQAINALNCD